MLDEKDLNNAEMDFEKMMEQRMKQNFGTSIKETTDVSNDRLKEMNKKLPSWSLEPPYSFLR